MIIIEGCDATGKTTLVQELAYRSGFTSFKDKYHNLGAQFYLERSLERSISTIADRFHLGEYVYPIVKQDGRAPLSAEAQLCVERSLLMSASVLIYCETDQEFIKEKFDSRGEDFVRKSDVPLIINLFQERYKLSILPKMTYDLKQHTPEDVIDFIQSEFRKRKDICGQLARFESSGEYLNSPIMLVGESYTHGQHVGSGRLRAFTVLSDSSLYLHQALLQNLDKSYYITNAFKHESEELCVSDLLREVELVKPEKVIALGHKAAGLLSKTGVTFSQSDHPQYRRRFLHHEVDDYAAQLI